ncbi:Gfo/Idh/MocA family protein [Dokdonia sp. Hel_I_53]|uniref:Gfo/Idh/MocA family protein n=1 Tax=Dokdonia sp. Hel_I_53 TaxID=1566287 RepID=UPI00119BB55A|nr:Gfo/Idh/MocA family oxidoreductase [Dokdonia sp. Hel_I_53]TVZ51547.1 putative dehydrogenase [Dokdonia sp. Hel_I_53]
MIYWGILGCGKIAHKFASDLKLTKGGKLYAVASRSLTKATEFALNYEAPVSYGSYEELVKDPRVHIIYIATPHKFHMEQAMLCLTHKKGVLCEKAFAMNQNEVMEMVAAAKKHQFFLMEALWTQFLPHFKFVSATVKNGDLGKIRSLKADFGIAIPFDKNHRLYNKEVGGGSLLDVGIYPVFAALSFLGFTDSISASAIFGPTEVDHRCELLLSYPNGVNARLCCAIDKKTDTTCHIIFESGEIIIHARFHEPSNVTIIQNGITSKVHFPTPEGIYGYHYEILHCQEMLTSEKIESPVMSFKKSLQLIKMLDLIREEIGLQYS